MAQQSEAGQEDKSKKQLLPSAAPTALSALVPTSSALKVAAKRAAAMGSAESGAAIASGVHTRALAEYNRVANSMVEADFQNPAKQAQLKSAQWAVESAQQMVLVSDTLVRTQMQ